jgi:hypothetical protein
VLAAQPGEALDLRRIRRRLEVDRDEPAVCVGDHAVDGGMGRFIC